jgi:hypothetical protein
MDSLTDDLFERIVVAGGQDTAIQCMPLNSRAYKIATRPICWRAMHVRRPGIGSMCFLAKCATRCTSIVVESSRPVDLAWFVHGAAMHIREAGNTLRHLELIVDAECIDVPNNLVSSALGFVGLEYVRIAVRYPHFDHTPMHFIVPPSSAALPTLKSFKFYDQPGEGFGALSVIFGGSQSEMLNLHTLRIRAPYTDFFDAVRPNTMPPLTHISYMTDGIPRNMSLPSSYIKSLEIRVQTGMEARSLFNLLMTVRKIDTLVLHDDRIMPVFGCAAKIRRIFIYVDGLADGMNVHIDTERLATCVEVINVFGPRTGAWRVVAPHQPSRTKVAINTFR